MHKIPKPEFPRPEKQRIDWLNLNGEWDFRLFPEGDEVQEKSFRRFAAGLRQDHRRAVHVDVPAVKG